MRSQWSRVGHQSYDRFPYNKRSTNTHSGESPLQMSSNVTSQATPGSLGKPGIASPNTFMGSVPFLHLHPQTHQKTSPYSSISLENLAAAALVSMLNEQACLSLQLATHDPASERARNHFIFIKNGTVPSCADNQNSTAQHAKLCTEHSSSGQFPRLLQPPRIEIGCALVPECLLLTTSQGCKPVTLLSGMCSFPILPEHS